MCKNPMCMLFGFVGGILMMWWSVGDGILTSTSKRVGSQMRRWCSSLMKHRCRTRMGNSGTICSSVYTTTLSVVPCLCKLCLLPTADEGNLSAAGLLFTHAEFDELVSKHYPDSEYHFHPSFLEMVFKITDGHVGAMYSFFHIILGSDQYRELKHSGQCYTLELFQKTGSPVWFLQQFESAAAGVFRRGLLPDDALRVLAVACVFFAVLCMGSMQDTNFTTEDNTRALQLCFSEGWLHTDYIDNKTEYFFPSTFHRWYVEWKLWDILDTTFHADKILDFVINVISIFSPQMLSTKRRVTTAGHVQHSPQAQYQNEFYRCCHTHSNGSLILFPEFGTTKGQVDFYIPAKQWGVTLLQDGDQLVQHSGQFSSQPGLYGTTLPLIDYIILDCCTTTPRLPHPDLQKLFHIVFNDGFSQVKILDNELKEVPRGEFMLLAMSL
ncbi:uncharacterized protein LACBIDRAFT_297062 [Laccaria bicolor S238N-H82]|uniref:Predicted protein n=1 Tax=Laccaria bicolor (strain S238N-H82 / ATCC MYA-4686) TaxID=486041 RepID=B0D9W9_LACBS|nr:uncharacterized protein LACBIDRAFT_297062 [Laccaria bicolor S238N-H82]EDR08420.1 predicted protein [Laccaria bicolor S238N-H82]|eukprot:XP_001880645.1 predicted protein [Laccaria bicolor S238N-H82]